MSGNADDRALGAVELDMVKETLPEAIGLKTSEDLKALAHRLRTAHQRARDIAERQQREMRGKAEPHGARPASDAAGSVAKTEALMEAIRRVDEELSRREAAGTGKPSPSEFARKALEMKMAAEETERPDAGRTANEGMHPKSRTEEFAVGAPRSEVGRIEQQGKVSQARKDSGKG